MVFWAQVKVLELEKRLEGERVRLGELRKQHYVLAGGCEDTPEDSEARPAPAPRRGILKKPPIAQKPDLGQVGPGGAVSWARGVFFGTNCDFWLCPLLVAALGSPREGPGVPHTSRCLRAAVPSRAGSPQRPAWKQSQTGWVFLRNIFYFWFFLFF